MRLDGPRVAPHDRAGQRGVAVGERVVEGGGEQRAQGAGRVVGAGGGQHLHRLGHQRHQVVGAVGQARVVERAHLLGHPHRAPTQVVDEGLGEGTLPLVGGQAEDAAGQPLEVHGGAGEGHRGVHGREPGTDRGGRPQDGQAVAARGVHDVLALADRARTHQRGDDVAEHVVGHRQQQQLALAGHRGRLGVGDAREQRLDALQRGVGVTGGSHDVVAGGAQPGGEDGPDATRADDAHPQGGVDHGLNLSFQSRRPPGRLPGRCGYRTLCSNFRRPRYAARNARVTRSGV